MADKIDELRKDIAELESLEKQASRRRNKDIFSIEIRKLVSELSKLEEESRTSVASASAPIRSTNRRYEIKLNNYAWDQTNKFVKFYITLKNVHSVPAENVKCEFTDKSLDLSIKDLDNKDYVFRVKNLLKPIVPEQSNWKTKTDMIIINVAKKELVNWSHVTQLDKKSSDAQKPDTNTDKSADPTESLMSLMKNMYDKGDDEMKRTIAKAWTESQMKRSEL